METKAADDGFSRSVMVILVRIAMVEKCSSEAKLWIYSLRKNQKNFLRDFNEKYMRKGEVKVIYDLRNSKDGISVIRMRKSQWRRWQEAGKSKMFLQKCAS